MSIKNRYAYKPKRFDTYSYIKNEFLNADMETLRNVTDLYYKLYGYGPHKYLIETYYSWKSGSVSVSRQTMGKIIECVPKFLSDEKRFFVLKNELIYFVETLNFNNQKKTTSLLELNNLFKNYATEIENFNQSNLPYMVGKKIFRPDEIEQFLLVCKFSLLEKLNLSIDQVYSDLTLFKDKISIFKTGGFHASYLIDFMNVRIDLATINDTQLENVMLERQKVNLDGQYKQFAEDYILEEFMKMNFSAKEGVSNQFVTSKDLDLLLEHYHKINAKRREATLKSELQGEGGLLFIDLEVKSLLKVKTEIFYSGLKTIFCSAVLVIGIPLAVRSDLLKLELPNIIGGIFIGGFLILKLGTEIQTIKNLLQDLKTYGKQQSTQQAR